MAGSELKWAHFTCLGTPNALGSFLEKPIWHPFLTHLCHKTAHFQGILGYNELKMRQKHLFWHYMWSRMIF